MGGAFAAAAGLATALSTGPCKMVLVVRADLGMGKGKMCAQCAHAAVSAVRAAAAGSRVQRAHLAAWDATGQTKVALRVGSGAELDALFASARRAGLVAVVVRDAGRTQVEPGTATVLAVGPAAEGAVDAVTGSLKLL